MLNGFASTQAVFNNKQGFFGWEAEIEQVLTVAEETETGFARNVCLSKQKRESDDSN